MRALIAYFSRADENYFSGELRTIPVGNTEVAAKLLQRLTGADLFQLEPLLPYSKDYNECIAQAQDDQRRDARPELRAYPDSLAEYDTIYLGYPTTGAPCPCRCSPSWSASTSPARPSSPSAPTRAAAWAAARPT